MNLIRSITARGFDMIMVTRPVLLIPVWGFCALGFRRSVYSGTGLGIVECWRAASVQVYLYTVIFSFAVAAVYVINQISDITADAENGGLPLIASGVVSVRAAGLITIFCGLFSVFYPLLAGLAILAASAVATLLLGWLYSCRPIRLSGRPVGDFISNAIGYGLIAFGVGWILGNRSITSIEFLRNALPYFLLMCAGSISSTLPDYHGDFYDGKNTTAVVFGIFPAHIIATVILAGAAWAAYQFHDILALSCAMVTLPLYLVFIFRRTATVMEATYKAGGAICMFAAFLSLPFFLPLSFIVFIATWLYFRIRHGVAYPSLVPVKEPEVSDTV